MNWYEWNSIEDFDLWHNALCLALGYPETPINQATGEPDETAQKTTAYCQAVRVEDKYIAQVEDAYAEGLTVTQLRQTFQDPE
jgi:hypothetical protein